MENDSIHSRRSILKKIGATTVGTGLLGATTSNASAAGECDFAVAELTIREFNGVETEYYLGYDKGSMWPVESIEDEDVGSRSKTVGTVNGDKDVWQFECNALSSMRFDDTLGGGGASLTISIDFKETVQYDEPAHFTVSNKDRTNDTDRSDYYITSTAGIEPSDTDPGDSDEGYSADGYVVDGGLDDWYCWGRIGYMSFEPRNNIININRTPQNTTDYN